MNLDDQQSAIFWLMIGALLLVYGGVKYWRSLNG